MRERERERERERHPHFTLSFTDGDAYDLFQVISHITFFMGDFTDAIEIIFVRKAAFEL